jgi:hypothetical protein
MRLPDIPYRSRTPAQPQSAASARLPNQLRAIEAGVNAVDDVVRTLDSQLEQNAKLESRRAFNEGRRRYAERVAAVTEEYRSDRTKPVENVRVRAGRSPDRSLYGRAPVAVGPGAAVFLGGLRRVRHSRQRADGKRRQQFDAGAQPDGAGRHGRNGRAQRQRESGTVRSRVGCA